MCVCGVAVSRDIMAVGSNNLLHLRMYLLLLVPPYHLSKILLDLKKKRLEDENHGWSCNNLYSQLSSPINL